MPSLFQLPKTVAVSGASSYPGSKLYFYSTGTTNLANVYTNSALSVAHASPVVADSDGVFAPIYLDPAVAYKLTWKDSAGSLIYTVDPASDSLSADTIGRALYPRTAAEIAAGVTPTDYSYPVGNIRRYGAIGNGVADDTAAIQAAMTAATYCGRVVVPPGTYKIGSTLAVPMGSFGAFTLEIQAGAVLNYTGSSYCIDANTVGIAYANVNIVGGGEIVGTSSGLAGIRFYCFNKGSIQGVRCRSFSTGDGILIEGANSIDMMNVEVVGNKNGIHLKSKLDGVQYAANACRVIGGHINNNSQWGIYDDATGTGGTNLSNYYATTFDPNGANTTGTGNIFIQGGTGHVVASYLETSASQYGEYNIKLGDGTYHPTNTVIRDCMIGSVAAVTASIYDNGTRTVMENNVEVGTPTNFIVGGAAGVARFIGPNYAPSAGTFFGGTDNGDTITLGNASASLANFMAASTTGMALKTICGSGAPINIRARDNADTFIAQWQNYAGSNVARINTKGGLQPGAPSGSFSASNAIYQGTGVPSNSDGADGDIYFRYDTPGTANQRVYVKSAGAWTGIL